MSAAESQSEETSSPADALPETKPKSPVWPRGVHSSLPTKMDEPHAEQLALGIVIEEESSGDHPGA